MNRWRRPMSDSRFLTLRAADDTNTVELSVGVPDAVPDQHLVVEDVHQLIALLEAAGYVPPADGPRSLQDKARAAQGRLVLQPPRPELVDIRRDERHRLAQLLEDHRSELVDYAETKYKVFDLVVFLLRLDHS